MTDNEIIKALECCADWCGAFSCWDCPLKYTGCIHFDKLKDTLDLINRQKAEIERLRENNNLLIVAGQEWQKRYETANNKLNSVLVEKYPYIDDVIADAKAEAIKEFAERLKDKSCKLNMCHNNIVIKTDYQISGDTLNNLVKEMVGNGNG